MIPTSRKSPSALALDIVAGSDEEPGGYGEEYGGEEDEPDEDDAPSEDPQALLDRIQANIDQLRASF